MRTQGTSQNRPLGSILATVLGAICTVAVLWSPVGRAETTRTLPFSGRLLDDQAHAVAGPVDLQLNLFKSEADPEPLKTSALVFPKIELADGVFHLQIVLTEIDIAGFGLGSNPTLYLQVKDLSHDRVYQRQKFSLAPPDVTPPTIPAPPEAKGSSQGRAELVRAASAACLATQGAGAKFLLYRSPTEAVTPCANACITAKTGSGCSRGWTLFAGDEYVEFGSECTAAPTLANATLTGRLCCCVSTTGSVPLTIGVPAGVGP